MATTTKARITLNIGESYSVGNPKQTITKNKPITTSDVRVIAFWEKQKPRVSVTPLAQTPDPIPSGKGKGSDHDSELADYEKYLKLRERFSKFEEQRRGAAIDIAEPTKTEAKVDTTTSEPDSWKSVKWTPASTVVELRKACTARDIAFASTDTKNTLIAMLTDHDAEEATESDAESDKE